jgi:hypothetical protein
METKEQVDACLQETGVTQDQLNRWRREGLLPPVTQMAEAYRGSFVLFPEGTCAQIRAAKALFRKKNRVSYVGLHLWRQGFPVAEQHWRPRLMRVGRLSDRALRLLSKMAVRSDREEDAETLADKAARFAPNDFVFSRISRRLDDPELPPLFRVLLETATGEFKGFESPVEGSARASDEIATIRAFDIGDSERLKSLGIDPKWIHALPSTLQNISKAVEIGTLTSAADAPAAEISQARDDTVNAFEIVLSLSEPFQWLFGQKALGLRLGAWIVKKAPDDFFLGMVLRMLRLRQVPGAIFSSEEIAHMAVQSRKLLRDFREFQRLGREDPRFKNVFSKREIRAALNDAISRKRWMTAVEKAKNKT